MNARDIVLRPLLSEKTTRMNELENSIAFEVARGANKIEIAKAVEQLFDVKVVSVRVVNRKGKPVKRYGRVVSHRPVQRKAYVKLTPDSNPPEFFEGI